MRGRSLREPAGSRRSPSCEARVCSTERLKIKGWQRQAIHLLQKKEKEQRCGSGGSFEAKVTPWAFSVQHQGGPLCRDWAGMLVAAAGHPHGDKNEAPGPAQPYQRCLPREQGIALCGKALGRKGAELGRRRREGAVSPVRSTNHQRLLCAARAQTRKARKEAHSKRGAYRPYSAGCQDLTT